MDAHWQETIEINAPVDRVYAYLADFPKHCEWAQTLERMDMRVPGDASGVGRVYRTTERQAMHADRKPRGPMPAKAFKGMTDCEITELVPGKRIAWRAHPVPVGMGVHARLSFDLAPADDGRTRLTQTVDMHQPWPIFQFFSRVTFKSSPSDMERKASAQWSASLANIKTIMEEGTVKTAAD